MSQLIITLLASYGLCFGLMNDKAVWLTNLLRRIPLFPDGTGRNVLARMLECPYCTGFHTGYIAWAIVNMSALIEKPTWPMIGEAITTAFASGAVCYLLDITAEWLEIGRSDG